MIRALTPADINSILKIDHKQKKSVLEPYFLRSHCVKLGVEQKGTIQGFLLAWCIEGKGEIIQISIAESMRRQGLGRGIMQHFINEYAYEECYLELRADNKGAYLLYKSLGFVEENIRKGYYYDINVGGEQQKIDAILMHMRSKNNKER